MSHEDIPGHPATNYTAETIEVAKIAAWFRHTGYLRHYDQPATESARLARAFLETQSYPQTKIDQVTAAIQATILDSGQTANALPSQLLNDAVHGHQFAERHTERSPLLRLEWELLQGRNLSTLDWHQIQLQWLLNTRFFTPYGKFHFEPAVSQNILTLKARVEKAQRNGGTSYEADGRLRRFQDLERKLPESATQTFFRANYRNHINLSAIADNKANIMISVNAILISVLISLLTYKNITETNPMVLLPVIIFLFTGLVSLIFAVLSIRPKVTALNPEGTDPEVAKRNLVFFGNFVQLDLDTYEKAMDAMFRDGELIYGNMVRDLYFLGKVLDKKYRFLTLSYNTFMIGFVATVITFLIAILG